MSKSSLSFYRLVLLSRFHGRSLRVTESGLSLLECLVAIVIISVITIAITPPIFLITATRVQNRRAEQATQLAQAEIDRIRTVVERGGYTTNDLPPDAGTNITNVPGPTAPIGQIRSNANCASPYDGSTVPLANVLPVDTDGDCQPDFLLQSFRTTGLGVNPNSPTAFQMGVRVYSNSVDLTRLVPNQNQTSLKLTSGLGSQINRPLAILYSTVVRNDTQDALTNYRTLCTPGKC